MLNVKQICSLVGFSFLTSNVSSDESIEKIIVPKLKEENKETKREKVKLTTYYTPILYAMMSKIGKYKHKINVYKRGKTFSIYVASSKSLYVEGYARIELPHTTFFIDHNWNYQSKPLNAIGKELKKGQAASRYYKKGTKFKFKGTIYTITDVGSGLSNKTAHIDLYVGEGGGNYHKQTYNEEIVFFTDNN